MFQDILVDRTVVGCGMSQVLPPGNAAGVDKLVLVDREMMVGFSKPFGDCCSVV